MMRASTSALETRPRALRPMFRALDAVDVDGDRTEVSLVRKLQLVMAIGSIPMILGLAALMATGGHTGAVVWCAGYCAATALLVLAFVATGWFGLLRVPHVCVVGALPVGMAIWMGGFVASGGAFIWTLLVPIVATMFGLRPRALYFIATALALAAIAAFAAPHGEPLTERERELHFAFNMICFTGFLYASLRYFVSRIDDEKARAEALLLRTLPASIVRRLKRGHQIADHLEAVTVVFADIVGFTPLAARLTPSELVELLDDIFRRFDELAARHGVEKIKTIGDAYMAVAGAPERCPDHAARAAQLALAMRDLVREMAVERKIDLAVRVGLHTGEAVGGVIGTARFAYDLWGDTVNTASRMESHGQPNEIQLTGATRDALPAPFTTRERGPIDVKGRGTLVTYWLDGYSSS
jgi:guanylate cyclase